VELLRVIPAFAGHDIHFATVRRDYRGDLAADAQFHTVTDATQWSPLRAAVLALQMLALMLRLRPEIVVSTGAAPGYFAVRFGKLLGARTIWIDSLANVDKLSKAGAMAGPYADLWLTQWPELAGDDGPEYAGQVI
jgi:UDP-N-acetylglucosamine:LPS N-acetylglucosamine transferase